MTLSSADAERLLAAGFLEGEVRELAEAKSPDGKDQPPIDLNSPVWQSVMKSRQEWIQDKVARNWTEEEILREIMAYYERGEGRSPWDFIRAEYKPVKRADYLDARKRRHEAQIVTELKGYKV